MQEFFAVPEVRLVIGILILGVLIAAGFYLVSSFRDYTGDDREGRSDALAILQEMHLKGDISDEEFRTIKATNHRRPTEPKTDDDSPPPDESSPTDVQV